MSWSVAHTWLESLKNLKVLRQKIHFLSLFDHLVAVFTQIVFNFARQKVFILLLISVFFEKKTTNSTGYVRKKCPTIQSIEKCQKVQGPHFHVQGPQISCPRPVCVQGPEIRVQGRSMSKACKFHVQGRSMSKARKFHVQGRYVSKARKLSNRAQHVCIILVRPYRPFSS